MAKKNPKSIYLLSLILFFSSCIQIKSTYQRENIEESIKSVCKEEYNLEVQVEDKKNTIWIYAPFENLTDAGGTLDEEVNQKIGNIILTLQRVILSMDKPPEFYAFVASDIDKLGIDLIIIGFIPDIVKLQLRFISRDQFFERRFIQLVRSPLALNDKEGSHIKKSSLDLGSFIALLVEQKIINMFSRGEFASYFDVKLCNVMFDSSSKNFYIRIDIEKKNEDQTLPSPFQETLKACHHYISNIYDFTDFVYINIEDLSLKRAQSLNKKALEELAK